MRFAVISDVHGNVEALRAVLRAIRRDGIRKIICLGDLVGYHAFPVETLALIRAGGTLCVAGNHDLIACGKVNREGDLRTRRALSWTRRKLSEADSGFLASLPAELHFSDDALGMHAALDDPASELTDPWQFFEQSRVIHRRYPHVRICFSGHTHHQQIVEITEQGEAFVRGARHLVLRPESFFFVNPGSVGSPADGDYRAAYAVYDDATRRITFRRTTYDRLRVMQENIRHGLTSRLGVSPVDYIWNRATTAAKTLKSRILTAIP